MSFEKDDPDEEQNRWYNLYAKIIYYRHYKYKLQEQKTVEDVGMVGGWIESSVPHDHEEYPLLQRLVKQRLTEVQP